jgi:hypothetical protein
MTETATLGTQGYASWDPSQGQLILGAAIDANQFVGAMPVALLTLFVRNPRAPTSAIGGDSATNSDADQYAEWQRTLEGSRRRNVAPYSQYILEVTGAEGPDGRRGGERGILPPMVLWTPERLLLTRLATGTALVLPNDLELQALDGGTQVAAWHEIAASHADRRKLLVPVVVHHGKSTAWARRTFIEINSRAIKAVGADDLEVDNTDPIAELARHIEASVELFRGRVSRSRQLSPDDRHVVTVSTLRTACATFALGIAGVQKTTRPPEQIPGADDEHVQTQSRRWFGAIAEQLGAEFAPGRRNQSVLPSPGAMAAIGAYGHPLIQVHGAEGDNLLGARITRLTKVDWSRGPHWVNLAGDLTPSGTLALGGGARQRAYAIFRALDNPESPDYTRINKKGDA